MLACFNPVETLIEEIFSISCVSLLHPVTSSLPMFLCRLLFLPVVVVSSLFEPFFLDFLQLLDTNPQAHRPSTSQKPWSRTTSKKNPCWQQYNFIFSPSKLSAATGVDHWVHTGNKKKHYILLTLVIFFSKIWKVRVFIILGFLAVGGEKNCAKHLSEIWAWIICGRTDCEWFVWGHIADVAKKIWRQ